MLPFLEEVFQRAKKRIHIAGFLFGSQFSIGLPSGTWLYKLARYLIVCDDEEIVYGI